MYIVAPGCTRAGNRRWGNFFNGLYEYNQSSWAIFIDPAHRLQGYESYSHFHPLFLYEFVWNALGCVLLLIIGRKFQNRLLNGDIFFLYVIYYSVGRFAFEGLKINVWTLSGIPTAQWICGIAIVVSIP
jgi:phosphatidylglycerol:prolipoprotein diacylglycerol transferase